MKHLFSSFSRLHWCLVWWLLLLAPAAQAQTPTFATPVTYSTGSASSTGYNNPYDVLGTDVNRDGKPDLLVTNSTDNSVGILLGTGTGNFQLARTFSAEGNGNNPVNLAVGDLNRDGNPDVVTGNIGRDQFTVFLGNGDGTLRAAVSYSPGSGRPQGVALADVNGDGLLDALTANSSGNSASVLLGNGEGTFRAPTVYALSSGASPVRVVVADVNGDGRLDLLTANSGGSSASVLLGNGNGTFQTAINYPAGSGTQALAVTDVNGDGRLDLLTANRGSNSVSVLLGNGNGTFQAAANYTTGSNSFPYDVKAADVNGDGQLDLITANSNYSSNAVAILVGNGNGTFQAPLAFGGGRNTYSQAVSVLDVNGDSRPDLLVANTEVQYRTTGSASVLLNTTVQPTPALTSLDPTRGIVGTQVTLTGQNLTGATAVRFNNTTATTFAVVNATTLTVVVPVGATTGPVTVTTPGGTSNGLAFTVQTAAPVVLTPANNSYTNGQITLSGTAPANSTVTLYLSYLDFGATTTLTTTATAAGTFSQGPFSVIEGRTQVYATAQSAGAAVSANSNTNTFVVDRTAPTVTLSSSNGTSGGSTSSSPLLFTATFSEAVTSLAASGLAVTNGTVSSGPTAGSGNRYTFQVTPTTPGAATTVQVRAGAVNDLAGNGSAASALYTLTYSQPVTAAPVVTTPANNSTTSSVPTFAGTAPTGSTVTLYLAPGSGAAQLLGTTTATSGSFSLTSPTVLSSGLYTVYATAQSSGSTVSANSNTNTFTVDNTPPTPTVTTTAPSPTSVAPIPFEVRFSEPVTGFVASDLGVTNGTVTAGSFSGSSSGPYSFSVTPTAPGPVTVRVPASVAQDAVGNLSTASNTVSVQYNLPNQAPVIANQSFSVPASSPTGTVVGTVVASDPDAGQTLTYSITAGNPNGAFTLVGNQLRVANAAVLTSTGTYALTVQVQDNGSPSRTSTATITVTVTPVTQVLYRLNAGGPALNTSLGAFAADQYFSASRLGATSNPIAGTTDDALYQTERFEGAFGYSLRVPNGTYQVVLHFAELYWTQPGQRIFDVRAENQLVLDNYDILRKVAPFTATTETFSVVVTDGVLNLDLSALQRDGGRDAAKLSALEVLSRSAGPNQPPVIANQSFSVTEGSVAGTLVGTVVASDPDAGQTLSYALTAGNTDGAFAFVGNQLQVANAAAVRTAASPFTLTVRVTDDGNPALSTTATVTVTVTPSMQVFYRLNAGGPAVNTSRGQFAADQFFSPSRTGATTGSIAGTTDDALYQTERFEGLFGYSLRVPNGTYQVVLHFAETYWTQLGQRIFDVRAENRLVLDNYDILRKVAPFTATTETFSVVVTDGVLNLDLSALQSDGGRDAAKLSALEVLAPAAAPTRTTLASQAVLSTTSTDKLAARLEALPNPFTERVQVSFQLPHTEAYTLTVYDLAGRQLQQQIGAAVPAGERQQVTLSLGTYPVGVYVVRLTTNSGTQQVRVIKH